MTISIDAMKYLAFPLVGLLAVSGSCQSTGGELPNGTGGKKGTGGRVTVGGGGANGTGSGGETSDGSGGSSRVAGAGGRGGTGGAPGGGSGGKAGTAGGAGGQGSKGGQGGSAVKDTGTGGARTTIDAGPIACDDIESAGRLAVYFYNDGAVTGQAVQLHFDVVNYTAYTARMQQVTLRYWFTDEDPSLANVVEQYYVPITTSMKFITLNPPRTGATTALELSFVNAPDAGASWVETKNFNLAFHKASYAGSYNQADDYSYDSKATKALTINPKITAYIGGQLAWGCEPPVQPVTVTVDAGDGTVDAAETVPDTSAPRVDARAGSSIDR